MPDECEPNQQCRRSAQQPPVSKGSRWQAEIALAHGLEFTRKLEECKACSNYRVKP